LIDPGNPGEKKAHHRLSNTTDPACAALSKGAIAPYTFRNLISTPQPAIIIITIIMSSDSPPTDLTQSGVTIPSDSENYDANNEISSPPSSSASSPLILYSPPTVWGLIRGAAINLFLPFVKGLMLGFGELFAHELAFRLGWSGTKVRDILDGPGIQNTLALSSYAWWIENSWAYSPCSLGYLADSDLQIFPRHRGGAHRAGPGMEVVEDPVTRRRRSGEELDMYTALE
jgi:hypothetical protein